MNIEIFTQHQVANEKPFYVMDETIDDKKQIKNLTKFVKGVDYDKYKIVVTAEILEPRNKDPRTPLEIMEQIKRDYVEKMDNDPFIKRVCDVFINEYKSRV